MGWEIGHVESGDDDAGVFVVRAGDINGNSYMAFNQSDLDLNEGWKSALGSAALAGAMAMGGGIGHAQAADLSNYNTQYLQQVASGEHPRPMVSVADAKAELQARANGKQQVTAPARIDSPSGPQGFSKEYLQKAADPNRFGRYMISIEKAQELLNNMQEGVAEAMERSVDAKGRTQGQWIQAVKTKFPDAKIIQSKMIDGPVQATLADGRTLAWKKVEQVDEIIDPTGATAKALRYIGRKFATVFPWLAVGGVGAGLAASGLMAPIVASMGGITTALAALSAETAFAAGMAGTYAAPSIIQSIKDLFAADENSIQTGIKRWVEKHVGDENDVQEFMNLHAQNAYLKQPKFRWRAKEWQVKMKPDEAEAYLEKTNKHWLDMEKQKVIDAEKAKADAAKAEVDAEKAKADAAKAEVKPSMAEGKPREKEADYGDDYQDMVARVKKLAGLGPMKTVYDPQKRVYRNVPTAVQPPKK
jgi:hypothetical protein